MAITALEPRVAVTSRPVRSRKSPVINGATVEELYGAGGLSGRGVRDEDRDSVFASFALVDSGRFTRKHKLDDFAKLAKVSARL